MKRNDYGFVSKREGPIYSYPDEKTLWQRAKFYVVGAVVVTLLFLVVMFARAEANPVVLTASWYSIASLKKEGTYAYSHGKMANGKMFDDRKLTAAARLWPLGTRLEVRNVRTGARVLVTVTDRIGRRFATTRIDLSKAAFQEIAALQQGVVKVEVSNVE
jgi:rare lipoprotein A